MKYSFLILTWVYVSFAQFPNTQYGNVGGGFSLAGLEFSRSSSFGSSSGGGGRSYESGFTNNDNTGNFGGGFSSGNGLGGEEHQQQNPGGKIHKFVSVHIAPPEDPSKKPPTRPQIPQKPETHYQIVFIKAPTPSSQDAQEIHLPPAPETKTLVYVLLKKPGLNEVVKVKSQPTPKPTPPEVFFIRYKGSQNNGSNNGGSNGHGGQDSQGIYGSPGAGGGFGLDNEVDVSGGSESQYGSPF